MPIDQYIAAIHQNNKINGKRFVITTTGGAFTGSSLLMSKPGASSSILLLNGPYTEDATLTYMENQPKSFASLEAGNELSITSLKQCREFNTANISKSYGIGITCALATNRWLKGDHRCYIVITSNNSRTTLSLNLYKGTDPDLFRSRTEEDMLCSKILIFLLAYICNVTNIDFFHSDMQNILDPRDKYEFNEEIFEHPIHQLIENKNYQLRHEIVNSVLCQPNEDGTFTFINNPSLKNVIMLPGSFNPLHQGHISTLENSSKLSGKNGVYELCIVNADKPVLSYDNIMSRLDQFKFPNINPIILTNAPLFADKNKLFPGISYSIGIDLAIRLVNPKYTSGDMDLMIENILRMTFNNTKFYVNSRTYGSAHILDDFPIKLDAMEVLKLSNIMSYIPTILRKYFIEVDQHEYMDLSSSALRKI